MTQQDTCSFAYPGTYGHECGSPAVVAGIKPSSATKSGIFYALRCAECAAVKGGENSAILRFEPFDITNHQNEWK